MVDLEPFLEAPFESASNVSFELLLGTGIVLLAVVAFVGRTTATTVLVSLYLLAIPAYVGFRIRVWESPDEDTAESETENEETDGSGRTTESSDDQGDDSE